MSNEYPLMGRAQLAGAAGQQFGGARDMYEVLGYRRTLTPQDYHDAYERGDIASRVVDSYPDATWGEPPTLEGIQEPADLWRTLHRLDRLTNLGHYGVLLLGLDGGEPMHTPAERNDYQLLYMRPHSERTAQILQWEDDPSSPRYAMPKMYGIESGVNWPGAGAGRVRLKVHHSRVIHVAERAMEDPSIGTPRLQRVFNRLFDLDKLLGGGAEIYWKNAAMMINFNADAGTEYDDESRHELRTQFEELMHGLTRYTRTQGVTAEQLSPGMQGDPAGLIDKQLDFIAGATGIPKRILIGSERGELASSQDETAWSNRIMERREQHAGPNMLAPLIDKLMRLGCLPSADYDIEWPEDDTLGEQARAEIAKTKAETISTYLSVPGAEAIATDAEVREWVGLEGDPPTAPAEDPIDETDPEAADQFNQQMSRVK